MNKEPHIISKIIITILFTFFVILALAPIAIMLIGLIPFAIVFAFPIILILITFAAESRKS